MRGGKPTSAAANVPRLLARYHGREAELLTKVRAKYAGNARGAGVVVPPLPPGNAPRRRRASPARRAAELAAQERKRRETKARFMLKELVVKERDYISHLSAVKRHWVAPLTRLRDDGNADAARLLAYVFGNWTALHELHLEHIDALEQAVLEPLPRVPPAGQPSAEELRRFGVAAPEGSDARGAWSFSSERVIVRRGPGWAAELAAVFKTLAPMLKLYTPYCTLYATATAASAGGLRADAALAAAAASGGDVAALLAAAAAGATPHSLASLRIAPVQRVCRYRLVLTDLAKTLRRRECGAGAWNAMRAAIASLEASLADVNAAASAAEEAQLLRRWNAWQPNAGPGHPPVGRGLIDPSRRLLWHGTVHVAPPASVVRVVLDVAEGRPSAPRPSACGSCDAQGFWLAPDGGRIISPHASSRALNAHKYRALFMSNPPELCLFYAAAAPGRDGDDSATSPIRRRASSLVTLLQSGLQSGRVPPPDERTSLALRTSAGKRASVEGGVALALASPASVERALRDALDGSDRFLVGDDDAQLMLEGAAEGGADADDDVDDELERALEASAPRCFALPALLVRAPLAARRSSRVEGGEPRGQGGGVSSEMPLCHSWLLKKERGKTSWVWQYFTLVEVQTTTEKTTDKTTSAARIEYSSHPWSSETFGRARSGMIELTLAAAPAARKRRGARNGAGDTAVDAMSTASRVVLAMAPVVRAEAAKHAPDDPSNVWAQIVLTPNPRRPGESRTLYAQSNAIAARWARALASCGARAVSSAQRAGCCIEVGWRCFKESALEASHAATSRRASARLKESYRIKQWRAIGETVEGLRAQAERGGCAAIGVSELEGGDAIFYDAPPQFVESCAIRAAPGRQLWLAPSRRLPREATVRRTAKGRGARIALQRAKATAKATRGGQAVRRAGISLMAEALLLVEGGERQRTKCLAALRPHVNVL